MNTISARRRVVALLLLPFMLVLAGCGKLHAEFDIKDADTINVSYDVAIDTEYVESDYDSADEMCTDMEDEMSVAGEISPTVEPYEKDDQYGCVLTGVMTSDNFGEGFDLTEEDGEFHLVLDGGTEADTFADPEVQELGIDFRMAFTFPGKIIESSGGEVDGNTVTFTDLSELAAGIDVRADAGGFPWIIVIVVVLVLGFLLLLVVAAIVFFVLRARKKKNGSGPSAGMPAGYAAGAMAAPSASNAPPAAPQGQQWGQASPPAAPQDGQQWGQASPPAAPQGDQQWGQASPPPAAPQDGQQWGGQPQQGGQPWEQPGNGQQPGQQNLGGQPWDKPGNGQQPPQNPGW